MTEDQFLDVAAAILDGTPVAWATLPEPETDADRRLLGQLRLLADVTRLHRAAQSPAGTLWGPLLVAERIGSGTFGEVYRASDPALERDVALKLLRSSAAGRHRAEGRLLARVRHPNIVTVFGAAEHNGAYGIWMEFVQGQTLAQRVAVHGPLPASEVTAIGLDVCHALAAVHASGLLHGDIKAQNVMREDSGRIVLMDFGTGRVAGDEALAATMAGTPLYVAPEILNGEALTVAADIYSVGVLFYFLLTGAFPIEGRTLAAIRAAHASGARTPVRARRSDIPRRLAAVIDRATAPAPAERIQSAIEIEAAIAAVSSKNSGAASRAISHWWLIAAMVVVASAVGVGWWTRTPMTGVAQSADLTIRRVFPAVDLGAFGPPSADGRYIAYSQFNGDLGLLDLSTGRGRVLIHGEGSAATAGAISPDSTQIAYAWQPRGANAASVELRIADLATQTSRTVYANASISRLVVFDWSREGRDVLAVMTDTDRGNQIATISVVNGAVRVIKRAVSSPWKASLSPDGRFVAYDALPLSGGTERVISIAASDGSVDVPLAVDAASSPVWTPDGRAIIYQSDRTGTIGRWMVPVTDGRAAGDPIAIRRDMGRMTPLGATGHGAYYYLLQTGMVDVYVAPIDPVTGHVAAPASVASKTFMGSNWFPDWSPDGRYLAYVSERSNRLVGSRILMIRTVDGGSVRELSPSLNFFSVIRWSRDGRSLLLRGSDRTNKAGLFEVDGRTGAILRTMRTEKPTNDLEWSTDGRYLFYTMSGGDVLVRDANGRDRPIPYGDRSTKYGLAKSADDQWLALSRVAGGTVTLSIMPAGGGPGRDLLTVSRPDFVSPAAWTADGQYLLFTRWRAASNGADEGDRRTLWRIAANGGEPEYLGLNMPTMRNVRLSPDGAHIAFTSGYAGADLWVMENFVSESLRHAPAR